MTDGLMVLFLVVIVLVGIGVLFLVTNGRRGTRSTLDVERYRRNWLQIERQLVRDQPASYHLTILNADKLLDHALKQRGFKGETMGERMKTVGATWSNANNVWTAHKLRNQIAHEHDVDIRYDDARRALASFKQALKDVGAI